MFVDIFILFLTLNFHWFYPDNFSQLQMLFYFLELFDYNKNIFLPTVCINNSYEKNSCIFYEQTQHVCIFPRLKWS